MRSSGPRKLVYQQNTLMVLVWADDDVSTIAFALSCRCRQFQYGRGRGRSCVSVRRSSNRIGPPHCGHCQRPSCRTSDFLMASVRLSGGSAAISWRQRGGSAERLRVLRMPECRIRTKRGGSTCSRKRETPRRAESSGALVLVTESRHRKAPYRPPGRPPVI